MNALEIFIFFVTDSLLFGAGYVIGAMMENIKFKNKQKEGE